MDTCNICKGSLIDPRSGNQCSCVIKTSLKRDMNPILLKSTSFDKSFRFPLEHMRKFKSTICTLNKSSFNSMCKYYFSLEYIATNGRFTHVYSTARELISAFLDPISREAELQYTSCDALFLTIFNDPENKYMTEVIPYLVAQRYAMGKTTWICVEQKIYQSKAVKYGGMIESILVDKSATYISSFKPVGWSS